jgi:hypothetical protein
MLQACKGVDRSGGCKGGVQILGLTDADVFGNV